MSFCTNCGDELADEDQFCATCGSAVETAHTPDTPRGETANEKKTINIIFYLALAGMFVFWLFSGMSTNRFWWR